MDGVRGYYAKRATEDNHTARTMLNEISQRKTDTMWHYSHGESRKTKHKYREQTGIFQRGGSWGRKETGEGD